MQKSLDIRGSLGSHRLNAIFCILAHILSNIGSILIKFNVVCPAKLEKLNESNILQVSEIFLGVLGVFYYSCF